MDDFLPYADVGGHAREFANVALPPKAITPSLIAPYVFGPING